MDTEAETLIKACIPSQSTMPPLHLNHFTLRQCLRSHGSPFTLSSVIPFPTGKSLLVCVDACSWWQGVEIIRSTSSEVTICHLQKIFTTHGLPAQVTSDNGSSLVSKEIEDFFSHCICHRKVTPYWPQANVMMERFNRTVEKAICTAHVEGKDRKKALDTFLLNYRATPHAMTGVSPSKLLFGRDIQTKLPEFGESEKSGVLDSVLALDLRNKAKMKQYSDEKNRSMPSAVTEGDMVLLKRPKTNKLSTSFDPNVYRVVKRQGTSVLLQRGKEPVIMRNVSWTRKIENSSAQQPMDDEDGVSEQPCPQEPAATINVQPLRARRLPA